MTVKVRFAPSPTGYLHIGSARSALFNWLYAKKVGGEFLLRIEDTDLQRSTEESTRSIIEGLEWLGLHHDGEIVFQSRNVDRHRSAAYLLLEAGKAYRDFTPKEERSDANVKQNVAARAQALAAEGFNQRSNPYRDLSEEESNKRAAAGEPFAIRLKVPLEGKSTFEDKVYGLQERDYSEIEDLVLLRTEGNPLYNLSVVIDDIDMGITDVIRGQDHLTNTHKQILIYQALGARIPQFAHLPLILAPGGKKLSKRIHGEIVSLTTYRDAGFLPEAFRNFLALLGWAPTGVEFAAALVWENEQVEPDPRVGEIMNERELVDNFTLERIHRSPAVFNFDANNPRQWTDEKAIWINAQYIRYILDEDRLLPLVKAELRANKLWREEYDDEDREHFIRTVDMIRRRYFTLKDFSDQGRAYFSDDFDFDEAAVNKNLKKNPDVRELLQGFATVLDKLEPFNAAIIEKAARDFAEEKSVKVGLVINAARTMLTGQGVGPSMFEIFELLGRDSSVERMRSGIPWN